MGVSHFRKWLYSCTWDWTFAPPVLCIIYLSSNKLANQKIQSRLLVPLNSQAQVARLRSVHVLLRPNELDILVETPMILQEGADMTLMMRFLEEKETNRSKDHLNYYRPTKQH